MRYEGLIGPSPDKKMQNIAHFSLKRHRSIITCGLRVRQYNVSVQKQQKKTCKVRSPQKNPMFRLKKCNLPFKISSITPVNAYIPDPNSCHKAYYSIFNTHI